MYYFVFICRISLHSFEEISAFQKALKEFVASADPVYSKQHEEFYIALEGRYLLLSAKYVVTNMITNAVICFH